MWIPVITLVCAVLVVGTRRPGIEPAGERSGCDVAILLVVTGSNPASMMIDRMTGGHGFSHVAVDACEVDRNGTPLAIDCRPGAGVTRRPLAECTEGRGFVRVSLPLLEGRELYGCVRGRVGVSFDLLGLMRAPNNAGTGLVCSQLVWECLPARLRERIPAPRHRPVAPNDFAQAFGARPGGSDLEVR